MYFSYKLQHIGDNEEMATYVSYRQHSEEPNSSGYCFMNQNDTVPI